MDLRENLRGRPDVPDDQVDDVIELAARLQKEARAKPPSGATVADVQAVAAELDIEPEFVEQAIVRHRQDAEQTQAARVARSRRIRRLVLAFVAVDLVVLGMVGGFVWMGARELSPVRADLLDARTALDTALDRQADLGGQLVALGGADAGELAPLREQLDGAEGVEARIKAADAMALEVASRIGELPAPENDGEAQLRLNLQYEVTGSQNRVATEERRWREARQAYDEAASAPAARLALALGITSDPR